MAIRGTQAQATDSLFLPDHTHQLSSIYAPDLNPSLGASMNLATRSFRATLAHPFAFLPITMSLVALSLLLATIASTLLHGATLASLRSPDEGAVAHLWQLLMLGQVPLIALFALKYLRQAPAPSLTILALQASAVLASLAPVFFLGL